MDYGEFLGLGSGNILFCWEDKRRAQGVDKGKLGHESEECSQQRWLCSGSI